MGLFEKIFGRRKEIRPSGAFTLLNGSQAYFTAAPESVYEMAITRAAIHSFASNCAKLKPEVVGAAKPHLQGILSYKPNPVQDTYKFLYRIATILSVHNTAFIVPLEDARTGQLTGFYPLLPQSAEVVEVDGEPYMRYHFGNGKTAAIELERIGILTEYQYSDELIGESNAALRPTMQLIHAQNQGIIAGAKNSAQIRFIARISNMLKPEEIKQERKRFTEDNLSADNQSGMILYDSKFADLKQIESKPYAVSSAQMGAINEAVFQYFGTNAAIIQNRYTEEEWNAYYEARIEPFALQLSLVMSNMTYTARERAHGNAIYFTANRLQYASNATKLNVSTQLFDRGILSRNDIMDIWNLPHVAGGDQRYIRREYAEIEKLENTLAAPAVEVSAIQAEEESENTGEQ